MAARRGEKWADQPPGVVASTIAEMDFELAEPVLAALRPALDRHDLGTRRLGFPAWPLKGAMAVTASARDALARLGDPSDHVGLLGVLAAEAAFADGDAWLDALRGRLDANRALLAERLAAELPEIAWMPPEASFVAWLDCRGLELGDDPAAAFRRGGVALSPGLAYGPTGAASHA